MAEALIEWAGEDHERLLALDTGVRETLYRACGEVPDATTLQFLVEQGDPTPTVICDLTRGIVEKHLREFDETIHATLSRTPVSIPVHVLGALFSIGLVCEEVNRGDAWYLRQHNSLDESDRAGAYLASAYYWLRRCTQATPRQVRRCLNHG
jgi:hypothetical protein